MTNLKRIIEVLNSNLNVTKNARGWHLYPTHLRDEAVRVLTDNGYVVKTYKEYEEETKQEMYYFNNPKEYIVVRRCNYNKSGVTPGRDEIIISYAETKDNADIVAKSLNAYHPLGNHYYYHVQTSDYKLKEYQP